MGASLCGGYVLLGATWLIFKTEGELQKKAVAWARWGLLWVALGVALVSLATPLVSETVRDKWFDFPRTLGAHGAAARDARARARGSGARPARMQRGRRRRATGGPFAAAVAIFTLAFLGPRLQHLSRTW